MYGKRVGKSPCITFDPAWGKVGKTALLSMKLWTVPLYLAGHPTREATMPNTAATRINHTELTL